MRPRDIPLSHITSTGMHFVGSECMPQKLIEDLHHCISCASIGYGRHTGGLQHTNVSAARVR
jgi:hypothetical protein